MINWKRKDKTNSFCESSSWFLKTFRKCWNQCDVALIFKTSEKKKLDQSRIVRLYSLDFIPFTHRVISSRNVETELYHCINTRNIPFVWIIDFQSPRTSRTTELILLRGTSCKLPMLIYSVIEIPLKRVSRVFHTLYLDLIPSTL